MFPSLTELCFAYLFPIRVSLNLPWSSYNIPMVSGCCPLHIMYTAMNEK